MSIFKSCGLWLDMSRGGVMTVPTVKSFIDIAAKLEFTTVYLHMEDMYELKDYPFFGYMRGRYSHDELKEIDAYGEEKGIEIVPGIQTLGHMSQFLRHVQSTEVKDTSTELLCGAESTYKLIDAMLSTMRSCFKGRRIHIGMDEAMSMGFGRYFALNGYVEKSKIFHDHLNRVYEICRKYDFSPMIWDDVARSLIKAGGDFDPATALPDVEIVPWQYRCSSDKHVKSIIEDIKIFKKPITFAGTAWTHFTPVPSYNFAKATLLTTAKAAAENGAEGFIVTIWGDDGQQSNHRLVLPQVLSVGFYNKYGRFATDEELSALCNEMGVMDYAFCDIAAKFDQPKGVDNYVGKRLLWGDCFMNSGRIFDKDYEEILSKAADDMLPFVSRGDRWKSYYEYIETCLRTASAKAHIITNIRDEYLAGNKAFLQDILDNTIPALEVLYKKLENLHRQIWMETFKPTGFQWVQIRYGSSLIRLEYLKDTLRNYLSGKTDSIYELELEQLPCTNDGNLSFLEKDGDTVYTDIERFICTDHLLGVTFAE